MTLHTPLDIDTAELVSRRDEIITRIHERVEVQDLGFILNGQPSPCHIWTGPDSGTGKGGGYGRMSLNSQTVAVHLVVYTHFYGYIPGKKTGRSPMQPPSVLQPSSSGDGQPSQESTPKGSKGQELTPDQIAYKRFVETWPDQALWDGDPECNHEPVDQPRGGVKCKYCSAWFCF